MASLPRAPHSPQTKLKIANAMKGRTRSPETRKKISEAMKGRVVSEETKAKHRAYRQRQLAEQRLEKKLREQHPHLYWERVRRARRKRKWDITKARVRQYKLDLRAAAEVGDPELFEDVRRSGGHYTRRRLFHPRVSDGYYVKGGGIKWKRPRVKKWREQAKVEY